MISPKSNVTFSGYIFHVSRIMMENMNQENHDWKPPHDASVVDSSISSLSTRSYLHPKYAGGLLRKHSLHSGFSRKSTRSRRIIISTGLRRRQFSESRTDSSTGSMSSIISKNFKEFKKSQRVDVSNHRNGSVQHESSDRSVFSAFSKLSVSSKFSKISKLSGASSGSSKTSISNMTSKFSVRSKMSASSFQSKISEMTKQSFGSRFKRTKKMNKLNPSDEKSLRSMGSKEDESTGSKVAATNELDDFVHSTTESKASTTNTHQTSTTMSSKPMIKTKVKSRNRLGIANKLNGIKSPINKSNTRVRLNSLKRKKLLFGAERDAISSLRNAKKQDNTPILSEDKPDGSLPHISEEGESQCSAKGYDYTKVEGRDTSNDKMRNVASQRDDPTETNTAPPKMIEVIQTPKTSNQKDRNVKDKNKLSLKEPLENSITPKFKNTMKSIQDTSINHDKADVMATKPIEGDDNDGSDSVNFSENHDDDLKQKKQPMKQSKKTKNVSPTERPRPPFNYIIVDNKKREIYRPKKKLNQYRKEDRQNNDNISEDNTWTNRAFSCMFPNVDGVNDSKNALSNESNLSFATFDEQTMFF